MTVSASIERLKDVVKQTLSTDGPMKASEVVRKTVEDLGARREYKEGMSFEIREAIWSLLSNDEIILSPGRILHLPEQKIDQ